MPITPTYIPLATYTVTGSPDAQVLFSSIPATYRDLIFVVYPRLASGSDEIRIRFNGATSGYSSVMMFGDGSTAGSRGPNSTAYIEGNTFTDQNAAMIYQLMDYSATDKHKTMLQRNNNASTYTLAQASRWADTAAVTDVVFFLNVQSFAVGSTFSLYGIAG